MKYTSWIFCVICIAPAWGSDEVRSILTLSAELDDQGSRYLMAGLDQRIAEGTWLSVAANHVTLEDAQADSSSRFASVGLSHELGQWDLGMSVDHWQAEGDSLVSTDINGSLYYRFEQWTLGMDLARRDITLRFTVPVTDRQLEDDVTGNGYGVGVRYAPNDAWYLYASYMAHDYDGRIIERPAYEVFSRFIFTADDSLTDRNVMLGADYYWDRYSVGVHASKYRSAFDDAVTASYNLSANLLLSASVDMQLSLGVARPDDGEDVVYSGVSFSVYW